MTFEERKALVKFYLGKEIEVKIDRPIGTIHPKHNDLVYPINYGYIEGVLGGDGEELDVYILGVNEPLLDFKGKVIAIVHRENDVEDKLVACPIDMCYNRDEVARGVNFQEKYYNYDVEMA